MIIIFSKYEEIISLEAYCSDIIRRLGTAWATPGLISPFSTDPRVRE